MQFPFLGIWEEVNVDGGAQPQPAFSPGFNVCGVQCSAGLQIQRQQRCSLLAFHITQRALTTAFAFIIP